MSKKSGFLGFIKKISFSIFLIIIVSFFYKPVFLEQKLPIPGDTIVGLYHPFRDLYASEYPRGIPFKNFLITDPVRQTYIWKELAIGVFQKGQVPIWNPYESSGKPLLGNFQSGVFYPLNLLLLIKPFFLSWTAFIILQTILFSFFTFYYLRNLKLSKMSSFWGSIIISFASFSVVWLEWGSIINTFLWLPLVLLSIDKILESKKLGIWNLIFIVGLVSSFFAGHLQTFFYIFVLTFSYMIVRWFDYGKKIRVIFQFLTLYLLFGVLTVVQWLPTLQFIHLSARSTDQSYLTTEGWFVPLQQLIQFVAPDFFGNPTTLNYWGKWNYAELVGYIGVMPLIVIPFAFIRKNRTVIFYSLASILSLVLIIDNPISKIPYIFDIPFISDAQPTRLLSIIVFSLAVLSAFGLEFLVKTNKFKKTYLIPILISILVVGLLWTGVISKTQLLFTTIDASQIAKRNLILPTILSLVSIITICAILATRKKEIKNVFLVVAVFIVIVDLFRFGWKFTPFVNAEYLFPETNIIRFLQNDKEIFRVAVADQRIMAPNFFSHYKIQTIEGYDPLYLKSYGQFIASLERGKPDIHEPFGFNRIITPHNMNSKLFDFLNTKYVLSFNKLPDDKFQKIMEEGQTKLYLNKNNSPRAFFVENIIIGEDDNDVIRKINEIDLSKTAVLFGREKPPKDKFEIGRAKIVEYSENRVVISTNNKKDGYLVVSDVYYPTWHATIDGKATKIYKTNLAFRGVLVPAGSHTVEFSVTIF